jgi:L-aminopeptidase/D-esterase-like protein
LVLPALPGTEEKRVTATLPGGFQVGHLSDREGWTGCTVVLAPPGSVGACEVRGGGPGTRESDLLSPAASAPGADAVLLTGGSAFGLAAAGGVMRHLEEREVGVRTRAGTVPLVAGAVVFDLALGNRAARPDAAAGYAACENAHGGIPERGSVGVGTGCTVGKLLGPGHWTKGGVGYAAAELAGGASIAALAAVNAFGDVVAEDGSTLAGAWRDGAYRRTVELLAAGESPARPARESTTLVCLVTDALVTKTEAWRVARSASSGVARAVDPSATAVDGDVVYCLAAPTVEVDTLALSALAAEVTAAAIRDAVRSAAGAPGCPAAGERSPSGR